ncbi:MAG: ribosome silencing factor [Firmicutes bacterium]|nr:ribosome silencing factor [Bacillota bacterium]
MHRFRRRWIRPASISSSSWEGIIAASERGESTLTPTEIATHAARIALDKRASDVQILDLQGLTIMTDYFVIASGDNVQLVRAVCNGISEYLEERGVYYRRLEGWDEARWVLMDYGDVIVHVFQDDARKYYDLERLWGDAPRLRPVGEGETLRLVGVDE